ncbi:OB-fold nucleic acid binding domain-containing protein [Kitasatospora arboriphila]
MWCQGRGSAANSAVCYALGITSVDPIHYGLLFERFLSPERDGPPDIDLDIEHRRREEVIQYVYDTYGRDHAAQVADVITYQPRLAVRDAARALGHATGDLDRFARETGWHEMPPADASVPDDVRELAGQLRGLPRHLGIHSGGMVLTRRPVAETCPTEWARTPGRSVLQWDKDSVAAAGLVKIDLLGLGMLSALHDTCDLVAEHHGVRFDLATIPPDDPAVYDMLCRADTVGVFQVESRAQASALPRMRPRKFYDLVVQVALIRPGPVQGGSVHPYIRRRTGHEEAAVPHPLMERALAKTLGVPLFQEQMMQLAVDCACFSPSEADRLRQAMGAKRSHERVAELRERLLAGMAERGIPPEVAEDVYVKIDAFSSYGFPESHAAGFALLVYASAWLKHHHPAAFTCALLANQPMGFHSPLTLIADARRHGVDVRPADINLSRVAPPWRRPRARQAGHPPRTRNRPRPRHRPRRGRRRSAAPTPTSKTSPCAPPCPPPRWRRSPPPRVQEPRPDPPPSPLVRRAARPHRTGHAARHRPGAHRPGPTRDDGRRGDHRRPVGDRRLRHQPPRPARPPPPRPVRCPDRRRLQDRPREQAGRRRRPGHPPPAPADGRGVLFISLEDETGLINVVCPPHVWERRRRTALQNAGLLVHGTVERRDGATNLQATRLAPLTLAPGTTSRDFR